MERDFYVTLPSNSSVNVFPDNQATEYRTQLNQRIPFSGEFEVALVKITLPITWYNVPGDKNWYSFQDVASTTGDTPALQHNTILPGHYSRIKELVRQLKPYQSGKPIIFQNNRIIFEGGNFQFCDRLSDLLGVRKKRTVSGAADFEPDVHAFHHTVYVYADFVQSQFVGDSSVPLLQTIPLSKPEYGSYKTYSPRHLTYIPVLGRELSSPLIYLRDHTGAKISFNYGMVTVQLHFRPRL